jgi:drug/metabolite transporter (DMT)-like permease
LTRIQANLVLLLAGAMWGMGFVAQSTAMAAIGPFLFIGLRFAIAVLAILPFAIRESRRAERELTPANWAACGLACSCSALSASSRSACCPPRSPIPASSPASTW